MYKFTFTLFCVYVSVLTYGMSAEIETDDKNTTDSDTTSSFPVTSTLKPSNMSCETYNGDCKACVENKQCCYCGSTDKCLYHVEKVVVDGDCDATHLYYGTCKMNFKIMLIVVGSLSAVALLILLIVCCYCCCKKKGIKLSKDDIKWDRQREERKQIAAERRRERAERTEEIRKKYGLVKDSNPYQKFDA